MVCSLLCPRHRRLTQTHVGPSEGSEWYNGSVCVRERTSRRQEAVPAVSGGISVTEGHRKVEQLSSWKGSRGQGPLSIVCRRSCLDSRLSLSLNTCMEAALPEPA